MKYNKPIEDMDKKTQAIYKDLCNGDDKKTVANRYSVDLDCVMTIAQRYNTGQKAKKSTSNKKIDKSTKQVKSTKIAKSVSEPKTKSDGKHNICGLSDEKMLELLLDIENGLTEKKIGEKYGISRGSVYNIKKEYGLINKKSNTKTPVKKEEKEQKSISTPPRELKPEVKNEFKLHKVYSKKDIVYAGLIADRHEMPCSKYIFTSPIQEDLMFDYAAQQEIVRDFIKTNFKYEDGGYDKSLQVFVTGMCCCLASLIKVCQEMQVNLSLMHYNNSTSRYRGQVIWDGFRCKNKIPNMFRNNWPSYHNVYTYNCTYEDIEKRETFYNISEVPVNAPSTLILTCKKQDALVAYSELVADAFNENRAGSIYVNEAKMILDCGFKNEKVLVNTRNEYE